MFAAAFGTTAVCAHSSLDCMPAEDLDQAIERAVEAAVGAKYAKKVRKPFPWAAG